MAKIYRLTQEGLKKLEEELMTLKTEGRRDIAEKIKVARGYGDLSENSEYDDAKNEQAKIEARIADLELMLKNVQVIESDADNDSITLGSTVVILNLKSKREFTFKVVGSYQASPAEGKISDESPVGKALMGHKAGETVTANTPQGDMQLEILKIEK